MDKKIVIARIEQLMSEKGITYYKLRENTNISSTIYQWKKNPKRDAACRPSLRSIEKICDYLGVSLAVFFSENKSEEMSVKQTEIANKLLELSEDDLEMINLFIERLLIDKNIE